MLQIFQYDFMVRALEAGLMIALIAPAIGMFLVVKRYSLLTDTLSHVSLVGVAFSALTGLAPTLGALIVSSLAALGIEELRARKNLFGESVLALVLSGSLALAIVLFSLVHGIGINLISILFGSITTVSHADLPLIALCTLLVLGIVGIAFKKLFLLAYDEELAKANGLPVRALNVLLVLLAAVTVSISIRIVGTLLVGALMVIPVLTATQFKQGFAKTYLWAIVLSVISVALGLCASFYLNLPSGGAIVLVALVFFLASVLLQKQR